MDSFFGKKKTVKDVEIYSLQKEEGSFFHKGRKFVHHGNFESIETAFYNLVASQKLIFTLIAALIGAAFYINWHLALVAAFSTLTIIYFIDFLFNAFIIYRSFSIRPEIIVTEEEISKISESSWPSYTIFCPLYREWHVLPQFVEAISKLDYPKERLQILLLLEEDDKESIEKIDDAMLPFNFEKIIVPHSMPKTKPKAMNYGLSFATGEYVTIYDAEDIPESDQLKKAVVAFTKAPAKVACMQAKLNFYNPNQNILTRLFAVEYSLWFGLVLPGLQSINAPIPLGGTSNHFRMASLRNIGGWDAFNVTEDCDLGMRLAKKGFRTAIVESTTYEEANSDIRNWYNQRSRWIKGYIQTYLVHNRKQKEFFKNNRIKDFFSFQFVVGAKILAVFINPIMWVITACYFLFRAKIGLFIESFFPGPILYIGSFSLVFGNFLYIYYYMIGASKRGQNALVKYVFTVPLYWLGMSLAAWKAVYEIFVRPHHWSKTQHGLHLGVKFERNPGKIWGYATSGAGLLILSSLFANFLNFTFNAYLSRELSFAEFGVVSLISTFTFVLNLFAGALSTTANRTIAYLEGTGSGEGKRFFRANLLKILGTSFIASFFWIFVMPATADFFNLTNRIINASFALIIFSAILYSYNRGFLQGTFKFGYVAFTSIFEVISKFGLAVFFVWAGLKNLTALAFSGSVFLAWIASSIGTSAVYREESRGDEKKEENNSKTPFFPFSFYGAALMSGLAVTMFLSIDVLLAKHYLSADDAGRYALLSLVGKMIFFFGSLLNVFIVSFVSRAEGEGEDPARSFKKIFYGTFFLTLSAGFGLYIFGAQLIPLFFGPRAADILPYVGLYSASMMLFTISATIATYQLARKRYLFSGISFVISLLMVLMIIFAHSSIKDFVRAIAATNLVYLAFILFAQFFDGVLKRIGWNIQDAFSVFKPIGRFAETKSGAKRILIFNWRDIKNVYAGGAEVYIHELAKRWAASGHQVTIFASNDRKHEPYAFVDGVRVIRRGGFYGVYAMAMIYYFVHFRKRIDIIIDCENGIPFFTPLYAREAVFCLLHHIHQEVFRKGLILPLALFASFLEKTMMPIVYRNSRFITISESSKKSMEELKITKHEISIVNPGVDLESLSPAEKLQTPLVSYVGRLKDYKSVDILIAAFAKILEKIPSAFLVIAGDGEEEKNLMRHARRLKLSEKIIFAGKISDDKKCMLMQTSWVFVNPSMMEGWGITTIEANACGTAVVASDVPGLRDSVRDGVTGFLSPYGDVDALAKRILHLIQNVDQRKLCEVNALLWAKNFSWDKSSEAFLAVVSNNLEAIPNYEISMVE